MSKINSRLPKFLANSIIIAVGLLGQMTPGILYADLLLPFVIVFLFFNLSAIPKNIFYAGLMLGIYTITSGVISVLVDGNKIFYSTALTMRTISFIILYYFYFIISIEKKYSIEFALKIVVAASLLVTAINFYSGVRAYYGYAQLASWPAPAISGLVLGCISLYFFISFMRLKKLNIFLWFILSFILVFLTFSISGNVSIVAAIAVYIILLYFGEKMSLEIKIRIFISLSIVSLLFFLYLGDLIENFSRILKIFDKLEYRLDKVDSINNALCDSFGFCKLFGIGPGGHSSFNNVELGDGSVLAFDQLYGRIYLEWGIVGSFLWIAFFWIILNIKLNKFAIFYNPGVFSLIVFGMLFAVGSEFIFVSFSGYFFASILGCIRATAYPLKSK